MNKELSTITGTAGTTFPSWNDLVHAVTGANQAFVVVMGAIVLILTAGKLWLEGKIASRKLRDLERNHD